MSFFFFGQGYISRGEVKFSNILRGITHTGGPDRFRIFWGEEAGQKGLRSIFQGGSDTLEDTMRNIG